MNFVEKEKTEKEKIGKLILIAVIYEIFEKPKHIL
jgi:hypothetical protein